MTFLGPEISGSRPVLATFENFKDREEVLRKGKLSKNSNIHISEDLSKRTRETRAELRKFMRKIKKSNPDATCFMQYDKLYVNNKIYVFNDLQGRVSSLVLSDSHHTKEKVIKRFRFFILNKMF